VTTADSPEKGSQVLYRTDPEHPDPLIVAEAGRRLRAGGVIAHPSDTVYGLAAPARHEGALAHLRRLKGRDSERPFIILIDEPVRLGQLVPSVKRAAADLMARYWPGPLTLIFEARPDAPGRTSDGSIALRCPSHPLTRALVRECEGLMASTSANVTGRPTVESGEEALRVFGVGGDGLSLVIDPMVPPVAHETGAVPPAARPASPPFSVVASTIVDCRGERPVVVRPGAITIEEIQRGALT
jgi:L-threonylcarbamoyladenylate synthase